MSLESLITTQRKYTLTGKKQTGRGRLARIKTGYAETQPTPREDLKQQIIGDLRKVQQRGQEESFEGLLGGIRKARRGYKGKRKIIDMPRIESFKRYTQSLVERFRG